MRHLLYLAVSASYLSQGFETLLFSGMQERYETGMDFVVCGEKRRRMARKYKEHFCNHRQLVTSTVNLLAIQKRLLTEFYALLVESEGVLAVVIVDQILVSHAKRVAAQARLGGPENTSAVMYAVLSIASTRRSHPPPRISPRRSQQP